MQNKQTTNMFTTLLLVNNFTHTAALQTTQAQAAVRKLTLVHAAAFATMQFTRSNNFAEACAEAEVYARSVLGELTQYEQLWLDSLVQEMVEDDCECDWLTATT